MTFLLQLVLPILLITCVVNGQYNEIESSTRANAEKGFPFGKLRVSGDGKLEDLVPIAETEKLLLSADQSANHQPLPSPCVGARAMSKISYPKDKSKYIQCRDEFHYEIFTCPNGFGFSEQASSCDVILPQMDRCETEKPCLNNGQCTSLTNSTFKCTCRPEWTGDRCDTPMNSCVNKPCGPNAECRSFKINDYEQDYMCVCHGARTYGLSCQEVVPNPCLSRDESFYPFAFSQHAYIQCDDELLHFQPCAPLLYWNQEEKICDRKRPNKVELPKPISVNSNDFQKLLTVESTTTTTTTTTTMTTTPKFEFQQKPREENTDSYGFIPARVANRQQFQSTFNNQQNFMFQKPIDSEQRAIEITNQFSKQVNTNPVNSEFVSQPKQMPNQQVEAPMRQTFSTQTERNQGRFQNVEQQWTPQTTTESIPFNPQFGQQQVFNQMPTMNTQNTQRVLPQSQTWQANQQFLVETTTQGFPSVNMKLPEQPSQNRPIDFNQGNTISTLPSSQTVQTLPNQATFQDMTFNQQNFIRQQDPQNSREQFVQNRFNNQFVDSRLQQSMPMKDNNEVRQNSIPFQGTQIESQRFQPTQQQPQIWTPSTTTETTPFNTQFGQQQIRPEFQQQQRQQFMPSTTTETTPFNTQFGQQQIRPEFQQQQRQQFIPSTTTETTPFNTQFGQQQIRPEFQSQQIRPEFQQQQRQQFMPSTTTETTPFNTQFGQQQIRPEFQSQQNQLMTNTQKNFGQLPTANTQNNQRFIPQTPSWQNNQQIPVETTTWRPTTIQPQVNKFQQDDNQSWQARQAQNSFNMQRSGQVLAFQPQAWSESTKPIQQDNILSQKSSTTNQVQQPSMINFPSSQIQGSQFAMNQSPKTQGNQMFDSKIPQGFDMRSSVPTQMNNLPQDGRLRANLFETTTPISGIVHGFAAQDTNTWRANQQTRNIFEQRKQSDMAPTVNYG